MKKNVHLNVMRTLALLAVAVTACGLFARCGPAPEQQVTKSGQEAGGSSPGVFTVTRIEPVTANPPESETAPSGSGEASMPADSIATSELGDVRWFKWYSARTRARKSGDASEEKESELKEVEKQLNQELPAKTVNDSLALVAFDWRMRESQPEEGSEATFLMSWLFRKTEDIKLASDHRIELLLRGTPDKSHQHYLANEKHPDRTRFEVQYTITPDFDSAQEGDYFLVQRNVTVPWLPYRMQTFLVEQAKQEDGSWKYHAAFGDPVDLGWRADLGR